LRSMAAAGVESPTTLARCTRPRHSWTYRRGFRVRPSSSGTISTPPSTVAQKTLSQAITLLAPPRPVAVHLLDGERSGAISSAARLVALALSQRGFCICRGGLQHEAVADARREVSSFFRHGAMQPGGFTVAGRDDVVAAKRDDYTLWLHEYLSAVGGPQRGGAETVLALDAVLSSFGEAVVDALSDLDRPNEPHGRAKDGSRLYYTGRTDLMCACYPGGGAHYGPHVDNVDGDGREAFDSGRVFTMGAAQQLCSRKLTL